MGEIKYYLNKGKGTPKNRPVMLSYHFNGQRLYYYTGIRLGEREFNVDSKFPAKVDCIDRIYINDRLKLIRNWIGEIENEALAKGNILSPDLFRAELNNRLKQKPLVKKADIMTLRKYFDVYIEGLKGGTNKRTGHKLSKALATKYGTIRNLFYDFCTYEGREYDFNEIDDNFYRRFKAFMLNQKNYATNTYGRSLKFLKTILNEATRQGYNTNQAYVSLLSGVSEEVDSIYLTEKELEMMYQLDLTGKPGLYRVRDLFLIGCNTGLRFSDYTTITPEDIDIRNNRLRVIAQKTKGKVVIPLAPIVNDILRKYDFKLPKAISNQKFNEALKTIGEMAGINETITTHITKGGETETNVLPKFRLISSHVARRSFATNSVKRGVPPLLVMSITGHKTEKEFQKYLKLTNDEKADLFEQSVNWQ